MSCNKTKNRTHFQSESSSDFSDLVDDIGLDYTKEWFPSSREPATVHRTVAFRWVRVHRPAKNKTHPHGWVLLFGGARHVKSEHRAASISAREIVSVPSLKL